jgi:hypothetical protein
MRIRSTLRRWHMWLGWLVGLPILLWTVSGLVMVARPIEEVRGTALLRPEAPLELSGPPVAPPTAIRPITSMTLEQRAAGPRWMLHFADGTTRMADPRSGRLLPPLGAAEAAREVTTRYTGTARLANVTRVSRDSPPLELRQAIDAWQVALDDGTHFYVDADSGRVVARRTRWWRFYDFMWGLHILDLEGREDTSHPWLITLAVLSLVMVVLALVLLPLATRWRLKPPPAATPAKTRRDESR